jgi:thiol-disulfide isomerase/thioredoxin
MEREFSVACLCAEWCDTCVAYRPGFLALGAKFPQAEFRWIDIEEEEGYEVENFPTILVKQGSRELFNGVLLPHHAHLERLLEELIGGKSG